MKDHKCYCDDNAKRCQCDRIKDLTGKIFGNLTVLECAGRIRGRTHWKCICSCANKTICVKSGNSLQKEKIKTCGYCKGSNLVGQQFYRWTVLERTEKRLCSQILWKCRCSCQKQTIRYVGTNSLKRGESKSCGCLTIELSRKRLKKMCGKRHYRWNPNLTKEERKIGRKYPEYYQWRKLVIERDMHECVLCFDNTNGNLIAHHLDSYSENKDKRTNINNGVTLCNECHKQFHKEYGRQNNTEEQFFEFYWNWLNE